MGKIRAVFICQQIQGISVLSCQLYMYMCYIYLLSAKTLSFIFRSSILETYSLQCLDLFQSIIKLLKAINRCKIKMFWSWYFLSFEVNFPPVSYYKNQTSCLPTFWASFTPPHKYQSYDNFICYSIYSI